jgi:hypothetical protein
VLSLEGWPVISSGVTVCLARVRDVLSVVMKPTIEPANGIGVKGIPAVDGITAITRPMDRGGITNIRAE